MKQAQSAREAAEGAARRSYGKLIAFLAARTRDVATAEDALADAFAAALTQKRKATLVTGDREFKVLEGEKSFKVKFI